MKIVGITYNKNPKVEVNSSTEDGLEVSKETTVEVNSSTEDGLEVSKETTEEVGKKETKKNSKKD